MKQIFIPSLFKIRASAIYPDDLLTYLYNKVVFQKVHFENAIFLHIAKDFVKGFVKQGF